MLGYCGILRRSKKLTILSLERNSWASFFTSIWALSGKRHAATHRGALPTTRSRGLSSSLSRASPHLQLLTDMTLAGNKVRVIVVRGTHSRRRSSRLLLMIDWIAERIKIQGVTGVPPETLDPNQFPSVGRLPISSDSGHACALNRMGIICELAGMDQPLGVNFFSWDLGSITNGQK